MYCPRTWVWVVGRLTSTIWTGCVAYAPGSVPGQRAPISPWRRSPILWVQGFWTIPSVPFQTAHAHNSFVGLFAGLNARPDESPGIRAGFFVNGNNLAGAISGSGLDSGVAHGANQSASVTPYMQVGSTLDVDKENLLAGLHVFEPGDTVGVELELNGSGTASVRIYHVTGGFVLGPFTQKAPSLMSGATAAGWGIGSLGTTPLARFGQVIFDQAVYGFVPLSTIRQRIKHAQPIRPSEVAYVGAFPNAAFPVPAGGEATIDMVAVGQTVARVSFPPQLSPGADPKSAGPESFLYPPVMVRCKQEPPTAFTSLPAGFGILPSSPESAGLPIPGVGGDVP